MDTSTLLVVTVVGGLIVWLGLSAAKGETEVTKIPRSRPGPARSKQESNSALPGGMVESGEMERLIQGVEKLSKQVATVNKNLLVIGVLMLTVLLLMLPACPVPLG